MHFYGNEWAKSGEKIYIFYNVIVTESCDRFYYFIYEILYIEFVALGYQNK